jgi:predicted metal-dependent enzyme (double-stranded beta helix superfamily)
MFDLDEFIADCTDALREAQPALAVRELVERAVSRPSEIDAVLGEADRWTLRTLYAADDLTILQFVWPPHVVLFPHDHQMWAANGIYGGCEDNTFYRRTDEGLEISGGSELRAGDVALLGREAVHSVENPRRSHAAALHVYGGDFFGARRSQWDPATGARSPFDVEDVRRTLADAEAGALADERSKPATG